MLIENSNLLYRVLKPLIYYLFSSHFSIMINSEYSTYSTILLEHIVFSFEFGDLDDCDVGRSRYYINLFHDLYYTEEKEKKKIIIMEINEKLLTSYDEETNKKDVLLTFNEPFKFNISLDFYLNKLKGLDNSTLQNLKKKTIVL